MDQNEESKKSDIHKEEDKYFLVVDILNKITVYNAKNKENQGAV